jgi:hypothetical protein
MKATVSTLPTTQINYATVDADVVSKEFATFEEAREFAKTVKPLNKIKAWCFGTETDKKAFFAFNFNYTIRKEYQRIQNPAAYNDRGQSINNSNCYLLRKDNGVVTLYYKG